MKIDMDSNFGGFLSTLSLRRATKVVEPGLANRLNFYPRSPCGERHHTHTQNQPDKSFLSTLSLRRATPSTPGKPTIKGISIHALLAESDPKGSVHDFKLEEFLSTLSLRRATQLNSTPFMKIPVFLSTLSLRRATCRL